MSNSTTHKLTIFFGVMIGFLVLVIYGFRYYTKSFSPQEEAIYSNGNGFDISVKYSRPAKKGRKIFGIDALIPYDELWRTGANEAPLVKISDDILVNGRILAAGNYSMFSIPGPDSWMIVFNTDADQWGAFAYNKKLDALRVNVPSFIIGKDVEKFTIEIIGESNSLEMRLLWGQTMVTIPISVV